MSKKTHHTPRVSRPFYYYGDFTKDKVYVTNNEQVACVTHGKCYWFGAVDTGDEGKTGKKLGEPSADNENWRLPEDEDYDFAEMLTLGDVAEMLTLGD